MICTVLHLLPRDQQPPCVGRTQSFSVVEAGPLGCVLLALLAGSCELHLCPGIKLLALGGHGSQTLKKVLRSRRYALEVIRNQVGNSQDCLEIRPVSYGWCLIQARQIVESFPSEFTSGT